MTINHSFNDNILATSIKIDELFHIDRNPRQSHENELCYFKKMGGLVFGFAYPVPKGAAGPTPVVNPGGKTTGSAFTNGKGGANGKVDTMRIMNPTPPRGKSPGYPNGYIKYENKSGQGVDPYTGRTISNKDSHYPIK
ncbi:hypothetical protein [Shewanella colwelliana]|uniref:hypothetical protein n=1 Tax=Shewanella colwelliana TaxID=23 RepID=UPI0004B675A4|nr:hypothetical protein [Shewanella colwelliana]